MGIDRELAWSTVRRGAAASFMLDDRGARMVRGPDGQVRSAISLFVKGLHLVLDEALESGQPAPLAEAAAHLFTDAAAAGLSAHDDAEVFDYVRSLRSARPSSSR
jgi:3-hydroxyisobutyrate dehydrogenase-like beta-hydroxyacid dehydrogenase